MLYWKCLMKILPMKPQHLYIYVENKEDILLLFACKSLNQYNAFEHPPLSGLGGYLFWGGGSIVVNVLFIIASIVGVLCLVLVLLCNTLYASSFAINYLDGVESVMW